MGILPYEDQVVHPRGGSCEVELVLAEGGAEYARADVDLPSLEARSNSRPRSELHLVLEPHLVGHRPKQVHVEAGGSTLCVAELVGWIGLVDPDDDRPLGRLGAGQSGSEQQQHRPGEGTHRRPIHRTPAVAIPRVKLAERPVPLVPPGVDPSRLTGHRGVLRSPIDLRKARGQETTVSVSVLASSEFIGQPPSRRSDTIVRDASSELRPIFHPRAVALIGASSGPGKVGRLFMERFLEAGFERLYPVNPRETEILGVEAYSAVGDIPESIDLALVLAPPKAVKDAVKECAEHGVKGIAVITGSMGDGGEKEVREIEADLEVKAHRRLEMRRYSRRIESSRLAYRRAVGIARDLERRAERSGNHCCQKPGGDAGLSLRTALSTSTEGEANRDRHRTRRAGSGNR